MQAACGLGAKSYWSAIEIDHIVLLELGGSNDIANLFPEKADAKPAGYHVKDKLENKLGQMVCDGLRTTQREIASNWQALYKQAYGVAPSNFSRHPGSVEGI